MSLDFDMNLSVYVRTSGDELAETHSTATGQCKAKQKESAATEESALVCKGYVKATLLSDDANGCIRKVSLTLHSDGSTPQATVAVVIRKQSNKLHDLAARRRCELVCR